MSEAALPNRGRRVAAGSLDQVFSSTSNGMILFAVAVVTPPASFGPIALMMTALMAVVGAQRGALGTPLLLMADQPSQRIMQEGRFAITSAFAVGLGAAVLILAAGFGTGSPAVILAAGAPVVLCQDVLRHIAIADGRPHIAAIWDGLWFLGSLLLLVAGWTIKPGVAAVLGGWVLLGFVALIGMVTNLRLVPQVRHLSASVTSSGADRVRYGLDAGLDQSTAFAVLAVTAALLGSDPTAALRGATAVLSPAAVLAASFSLVVISESTRASAAPAEVWAPLSRIAFAISGTSIVVGGSLYLLPASFGRLLLGDSFLLARDILPVITIEYCFAAVVFTLGAYLKTFNRSTALLWLKFSATSAAISSTAVGALVFRSATGVAVGLAIATATVACVSLLVHSPWRRRDRATFARVREHDAGA